MFLECSRISFLNGHVMLVVFSPQHALRLFFKDTVQGQHLLVPFRLPAAGSDPEAETLTLPFALLKALEPLGTLD